LSVTVIVSGPLLEFVALTVNVAVYVPTASAFGLTLRLICCVSPGLIVLLGPEVFEADSHPVGWPAAYVTALTCTPCRRLEPVLLSAMF